MPVVWTVAEGEGVRIDGTDLWTVSHITEDGTAADLVGPAGQHVTLREDIPYRLGPGFRMWLTPGAPKGFIRLTMEAYVPLMHRHPPRDHKAKHLQGRPA